MIDVKDGPFMTVRVIDRAAMDAAWGTSHFRVVIKELTLTAKCPVCGGVRGDPQAHRFHEFGEHHTVDKWDNPCGHIDKYRSVLGETNWLDSASLEQ